MKTCLEIVEELATKIQSGQPADNHLARLSGITQIERRTKLGAIKANFKSEIELCNELGFFWVVDDSFIKKFKFSAGVNCDLIKECRFKTLSIRYTGDIPDFALDRAETFIKHFNISSLYNPPLTVHSMQPLPVKQEVILPKIDPALVGWFNSRLEAGVILAIWDKDKEIKVLGN